MRKLTRWLLLWLKAFWISGKRLYQEQYTYRASALAYATLFALVPLLTVLVSLVSIFPLFTRFINLTQKYIFTNFIPTSSTIIEKYLQAFIKQTSHLPTIGLIFLFFTAITLIIMVEHTLNLIWNAPRRKKKFLTMLVYWAVLLITPICIGLSIFISTYVFSISWFAGTAQKLGVPLIKSLPLLLNTALFTALYVVVPNYKVCFRDGLAGGFIAAILFEASKKGFAYYIKHFPSYELIYGTLATIPIFLIWIYISWVIILYGALVTHERYLQRKK